MRVLFWCHYKEMCVCVCACVGACVRVLLRCYCKEISEIATYKKVYSGSLNKEGHCFALWQSSTLWRETWRSRTALLISQKAKEEEKGDPQHPPRACPQ